MNNTDNILSIDDNIIQMQNELNTTKGIRDNLIAKLGGIINQTEITAANVSPKLLEAQLGLFTTMDSLLKSKEHSVTELTKTSLKRKETETNSNIKDLALETLKLISLKDKPDFTKINNIPSDIDDKIQEKFKESKLEITEDELQVSQ